MKWRKDEYDEFMFRFLDKLRIWFDAVQYLKVTFYQHRILPTSPLWILSSLLLLFNFYANKCPKYYFMFTLFTQIKSIFFSTQINFPFQNCFHAHFMSCFVNVWSNYVSALQKWTYPLHVWRVFDSKFHIYLAGFRLKGMFVVQLRNLCVCARFSCVSPFTQLSDRDQL